MDNICCYTACPDAKDTAESIDSHFQLRISCSIRKIMGPSCYKVDKVISEIVFFLYLENMV